MRYTNTFNAMPALAIAALTVLALATTGCGKEDDAAPATTNTGGSNNNTGANTTPSIVGADGALFAVKTITTQTLPFVGTFQVEVNTGVGVFYDDAGAQVNAGQVECNDSLFNFTNNAYVYQPTGSNITGIDFSSGVTWDVTGGNGIPAFTRNVTSIAFPSVDTVSTATTFPRNVDYTLATNSVSGADSVYFSIGGILKRLGGNATSCTFTAAELGTLPAGTSMAQIAAWTVTNENISGKDIYFGKETVVTRMITLQ
ncbi:MAG: hypothetical protein IPJ76_10345 [Flavobacteriales bacterium]|nr:MAG: hypothetical protein IPJ76_10345 [Flavobacteriales bacterium]